MAKYADVTNPATQTGEDGTAASPKSVYGDKSDAPHTEALAGGNMPHNPRDAESWGDSQGGSLTKGLSHQMNFDQESPEYIGLGNCGPNQLPLGPNPTPVAGKGASRFG